MNAAFRHRVRKSAIACLVVVLGAAALALPGAAVAATGGTFTLTPTSAIAGERVNFTGSVPSAVSRPIVLQSKKGDRWLVVARTKTTKSGGFAFSTKAPTTSTTYRAYASAVTVNKRKYRAVTTPSKALRTLTQTANLTMPTAATTGNAVKATAAFSPARPGRTVVIEELRGTSWVQVATGAQDTTGRVQLAVPTQDPGAKRYRAIATAFNGAAQVASATTSITISDPSDEQAPAPVSDLEVSDRTPDSVTLTWSNPADEDFDGIIIRRAIGSIPPATPGNGTSVAVLDSPVSTYTDRNLVTDTEYSYSVFAKDRSLNYSVRESVTVWTTSLDDTAPAPVRQPEAMPSSVASIGLSWVNPDDADFAGVVIRRALGPSAPTSPAHGTAVASLGPTATRYVDTGLAADTEYSYAIFARDDAGNHATRAAVTARTIIPDSVAPAPVTQLSVTGANLSALTLTWLNPADLDFAGVTIRRAIGTNAPSSPTGGTVVANLTGSSSTFTDNGLSPGTAYSYAVFALDAVPNYAAPATVTGRTEAADTQPPAQLSGLTAEGRDRSARLDWQASAATDLASYRIYRSETSTGPWTHVQSVEQPATTAVVGGLTNGVRYWFSVSAVDQRNNEGPRSAAVSVLPDRQDGISHCGAITGNETWAAGRLHVITCPVVVNWGATLTLAPGALVKAQSATSLTVQGTLAARGSSTQPIVITSIADDSVGGDSGGDGSDTSPTVNDWYGVATSQTAVDQPPSVDFDHVQMRYARLRISNTGDDRDEPTYRPRTSRVTNSRFDHGSAIYVEAVGPVEVTGNTVTNTDTERAGLGNAIDVTQNGFLAATTVSANTVTGASAHGIRVSVANQSTQSPVVQNNTVSLTGAEALSISSAMLVPANLTGNTATGTARKAMALSGVLVDDLSLPFQTLPITLGCDRFSGLVVNEGATLTINAGQVIKPSATGYCGSLGVRGGNLLARGTAQSPVVFTSVADDTAGGDLAGDGATTAPAPNDWGGLYVTDSAQRPGSVTLDHVSVRYAGVSIYNGGDDRDAPNYLARTTAITNSRFEHGSRLAVSASGPITVSGNTVGNTGARELQQVETGVEVYQNGYLAATTVTGNTVTGASAYGVRVVVREESRTSPVVRDNVVSSTGLEPVIVASNQLIPANLTGNTGSSTTRRGLGLTGTLVQDLTLPFQTLPVVLTCAAYSCRGLTVGEGVTLTLGAGTLIKAYGGSLDIRGGTLLAQGTSNSPVVFTSVRDDTVGGDYNADGTVTSPAPNDWYGISSGDTADRPASVSLNHVAVRYAGVSISNSGDDRNDPNYIARTTSITNSKFERGSRLNVSAAGPVTVTGNTVLNSGPIEMGYGGGIDVTQRGYLSPTAVSGNSVNGSNGFGVRVAVREESRTSPVVQGNTVANTGREPIAIASSQLTPANFTGNTATATTRRALYLTGVLVEDLTLPFQGFTIALGCDGVAYCRPLTVGPGSTMTINAGVVIKAYGHGLNIEGGGLDVNGTANSPVVFTSVADDTAGGDYTQDGTVSTPSPGSWSGITSGGAEYEPPNVSIEHASIRYAGVSLSNSGDDRDDPDYVPRTTTVTNSRFEKGSWLRVTGSGPVTVTANTIANTTASETCCFGNGISVDQNGYSSATVVSGNTVTGAVGYGVSVDVHRESEVPPVVTNNAASSTNYEPVAVTSDLLVPANLTGNTGSSSTRQGLVLMGRLAQNLTLPFGSLPVVLGGNDLRVGEGVRLTVGAGVVVKSHGGRIDIDGGSMVANGTASAPTSFTAVTDDSIGGDYNKDGNVTLPTPGAWGGLRVSGGGTLTITGGRLHYAYQGIVNASGSASFRGKMTGNQTAAEASCNADGSGYVVDARNVDWGTPTGPAPYGVGDYVGYCVLVEPWKGQTVYRARYWGGFGYGGWAGSAYGSYSYSRRYGGDPVDIATGNQSISLTDVTVPEPGPDLTFSRSYNSQSELTGVLGNKWRSTWENSITMPADSPLGTYDVHWGDGRIDSFTRRPDGSFAAVPGNYTTFATAGTGYAVTTKDGIVYTFTSAGVLTEVTDRNSNRLTITTNAAGQVTKVTDPAGRSLTMGYTGARLTSVTDPAGKVWTYAYSGTGDLAQVSDPNGAVTRYTYSTDHLLLTAVDGTGATVLSNEYDIHQRVIRQRDGEGGVTSFTYNPSASTTTKTDPRGGTRTYTYDVNGQVLTETDPTGATTSTTYTSAGLPFRVTDALGNVTAYTFDSRGNLLTVRDAANKTTTYAYNAANLRTQRTDPLGGVTAWTYDNNGNLTSMTSPRGKTTTYAVNARGLRTSSTDPLGRVTTFGYNAAGDATSTTDPLGRSATRTYDTNGRVLTETDALGHQQSYTYNARGDRTTATDALGRTTTTTYDGARRITSVTDPLGNVVRTTYNDNGLPEKTTDELGAITTNEYDLNGNLSSVTDPTNATTTYTYDASNRRTSVTDASGRITTTTYDANGRAISVTDPLGHAETRTYDALGRTLTVTNSLGKTTAFTYDANGNRLTVKDANNHTWSSTYDSDGNPLTAKDPLDRSTSYEYDAAGQLVKEIDAASAATTYTYDAAGRRTAVDYPIGADVAMTWDAAGRLITRSDGAGSATFTYDANGRMTAATDGLSRTVTYGYDDAGRLVSRAQPGGTTQLTLDAAGRIVGATDPAGNASWTYDTSGTLTGATYPGGVTLTVESDATHRPTSLRYMRGGATQFQQRVTYDEAGRIVTEVDNTGAHAYTYDNADQLLSDTVGSKSTAWTYDAVGNRLTETTTETTTGTTTTNYTYDAADQLLTAGNTTYAYDARGNLVRETTGTQVSSFGYDGADHLTSMTTPDGSWAFRTDDDGVVLTQTGTSSTSWLRDPLSGTMIQTNATRTLLGASPYATVTGTMTWALALDTRGTGRGRIPSSGAAALSDYRPFGARTSPAADGVPGFTGGVTLPDGRTLLGRRVLDPSAGRWTSPDPLGVREGDGGFGPYAYAQNDPLARVDPTGELSVRSFVSSAVNKVHSGAVWVGQQAKKVGYVAQGAALVLSGAARTAAKKVASTAQTVSRWAGNVANVSNTVSTLWRYFTNRPDGYNPATGSRTSVQAQDHYGGALMASANESYLSAQPGLRAMSADADRVAQCYMGGLSRTASTAAAGGRFSSNFLTPPQPKSATKYVDDAVTFFTGLWSTADYTSSCYGG